MTVIAYKDGVLASDSQITFGDLKFGSIKKIHRLHTGALLACSGNSGLAAAFVRWVDGGCNKGEEPKGDSLSALMIGTDGTVMHWAEDMHFVELNGPFHAVGNGTPIAIGAMAAGASAIEAVRIAIEYCEGCGGDIQSIALNGDKKW